MSATTLIGLCMTVIVEAYNLLAEADVNRDRKLYIYQRAEEAGRALPGEKFLRKHKGRLLLYPEAMPYLQALAGIVICYRDSGDRKKAANSLVRLIDLAGDDIFGLRHELMRLLAQEGEAELAAPLVRRFNQNFVPKWLDGKVRAK